MFKEIYGKQLVDRLMGRIWGAFALAFFVGVFSLSSFNANATHISGGSIKYKALPGGRYYIEVAVFRDCSGAQYSAANATVVAQCIPGGTVTNHQLPHLQFIAPPAKFGGPYSAIQFTRGGTTFMVEEVSDVCDKVLNPSTTPNTRCRGTGTILGYTRFKYSKVIPLGPCNYWKLGFTPQCCRNTRGSNLSSNNMYVETRFNTLDFPNNSAPDFADEVKPIPSACVGKEVKYGIGTIDHDGDSLRFEVNCAMSNANSCVTYNSGFSATQPADSFKMDSATGLIRFVPKTTGKRVVAFWVKEYERCTGKWKAQTLRDVQFRVESCTNNIPKDISGVSNLQGKNSKKLGPYKIQVCNGSVFSWEDTVFDPDVNDTLIFNSNYAKVLPGAQMNVQYIKKNKAVVKFTWRADIGKNPTKIFYLVYNDDRCNYPGNGFSVFELEVRNSTSAGPDMAICLGKDTAFIEASGGKRYQWQSVWGDSLIWSGPNRNVWGDTTATDTNKRLKFFPKTTTYLEVWSDMKEGCIVATACQDKDTVKIVAAKNYNVIKQNDTTICFHDSTIQIFAKPDSTTFQYTYKWKDNPTLSNDSIFNPLVTPIKSQYYYIDIESDSGCAKSDSVFVKVTPPMPSTMRATTKSDPACPNVPVKIDLDLGKLPTSCGGTKSKCVHTAIYRSSNSVANSNGTGNIGVANWPCPYGGGQASSRQQFLFTHTELASMGITSGTIDGIGFNVLNLGTVDSLNKYTIKMKCIDTNIKALNSYVLGGLTTVFNPKNVKPVKGWNLHQFDVNYNYIPNNNLIVDICWENAASSTSGQAQVAYVPTAFNSVLGDYSAFPICGSTSFNSVSRVNRPTIQFSQCGARDTNEFTYKWTPSSGLNSDTLANPTAIVQQGKKYTVLITDTFGKCSDTTSITLNVTSIDAGPDTAICVYDTIQLKPNFVASCKGKGKFKWTPSQYFVNDSVQNPRVSVPKTTKVFVTFSDQCGCSLTDSLTIFADSVKSKPIQYNPDCGLNNGAFKFVPTGGWSPFQYSIDSGKNWSVLDSFSNLSTGFYNLQMRDSLSCYSQIWPDTLFNKGAPKIDSLTPTHVSCGGFSDGEILFHTSGGINPLSYSVDSGATWVNTNPVKGLKAGKYKVYVKGAFGCTSFPHYITLTEPDTIFVNFSTEIDPCFQQGDGKAIGLAKGGTKPYTYSWSGAAPGASHSPVQLGDTAYTKLFAYNSYNLKIKDVNGCGLDTTFTIQEVPKLVIDSLDFLKPTCYGYPDGEIVIKVSGGNLKDSTSAWRYKFSIDSGKTFHSNYSATTGDGYAKLDSSSQAHGANMPITKGLYNVVVKDFKNCIGTGTVQVVEPPKMVLTAPQDSIRICVSTCAKLEVFSVGGNDNLHSYHWTPTVSNTNVANVCPDENSVYSVYSTDSKGCASNGMLLKVDLFDSLKTKTSIDTSICDGSAAQINVDVTGGEGKDYEYLWQPFANLSNAFVKNPIASPAKDITYVVEVKDKCGSPAVKDSVRINILPQPKVQFVSDTLNGCPPLYAKFSNNTNASSKCFWSFGDGSSSTTCSDVYKTYTQSGVFDIKLVVESTDGCTDSLIRKQYIETYPLPNAAFTADPQPTTILNSTINFKDLSDGRIVKWQWNFTGMDTSLQRNPRYRFPDEQQGKYPVRLDVTTDQGCTDDTIKVINIEAEYYLYVPTSFTPNGDGKNDVWKPKGTGFDLDFYHVIVFDRWGKIVFESYNYNDAWDGTVRGTEDLAAVGVYTWKIVTGDSRDQKNRHERFGNLTILK